MSEALPEDRRKFDSGLTAREFQILGEASRLATELDIRVVIERVVDMCKRACEVANASLILQEGGDVDWEHVLTARALGEDESFMVVSAVLDRGLAGWVNRNREAGLIVDTENDERWLVFANDTLKVRSVLSVPFLHQDRVLAIITLTHPEVGHFSDKHLDLVNIIASQAATILHNAQLYYRAETRKRQLRSILHAVPEILFILDRDLRLVLANQAALQLFGVQTEEEIAGRPLGEFYHRESLLEKIEGAIRNRANHSAFRFEGRSDKRGQDFSISLTPWKASDDTVAGLVVQLTDVTSFRELSRFKDEMLRMVSHDLRSPLSGIAGMADLIAQEVPKDGQFQQYMDFILRLTDRMDDLIKELMNVQRIRSSPLENLRHVNFSTLFKDATESQLGPARLKNIRYEIDSRLPETVETVADLTLLSQSMINLIGNAIKYTPAGGTVRVSAETSERHINFRVVDTGPGIPARDQNFIFESFYRVKNNATNEKSGYGLGLSLVKNVIERHHGEVWVKSEPDQGSEFGFWLPIETELPEL